MSQRARRSLSRGGATASVASRRAAQPGRDEGVAGLANQQGQLHDGLLQGWGTQVKRPGLLMQPGPYGAEAWLVFRARRSSRHCPGRGTFNAHALFLCAAHDIHRRSAADQQFVNRSAKEHGAPGSGWIGCRRLVAEDGCTLAQMINIALSTCKRFLQNAGKFCPIFVAWLLLLALERRHAVLGALPQRRGLFGSIRRCRWARRRSCGWGRHQHFAQ